MLSFKFSYTGLANVTVDPIHTISFEVSDDVPDRIEVGTQPEEVNPQLLPLAPVEIIIFDTNDNQMDGNIITSSDPWRVCASLVNENGVKVGSKITGVDPTATYFNVLVAKCIKV